MNYKPYAGVYTALVTPFLDGKVDWESLGRLVEFQISSGVDGLVPVGTTGESPTLDYDEHIDVIKFVVKHTQGRVPVIAGTGANSTAEAIMLTKKAETAGADGFLHVAPYYNKPSQEGLFLHFSAIAAVTEKPITLYSVPARCGIEIMPKTSARLADKFTNIVAVKEAGGNCDRVTEALAASKGKLTILSGDDSLTIPFMSVGARGIISVASNIAPKQVVAMTHAALAGDFAKAGAMHRELFALYKNLFIEANPVPVKYALFRAGIIKSVAPRLPLCAMQESSRLLVEQTLEQLQLIQS
ncbi:MAG: 4-hydroxy-tetrahydrodipicolinate synthase [Verrucomicrobiota bacterium]|nr:4-hydroxy-tetrahydrodipicolinate synthase [Verrucomicrobiota bacterium]